jgi:hypothetical protein
VFDAAVDVDGHGYLRVQPADDTTPCLLLRDGDAGLHARGGQGAGSVAAAPMRRLCTGVRRVLTDGRRLDPWGRQYRRAIRRIGAGGARAALHQPEPARAAQRQCSADDFDSPEGCHLHRQQPQRGHPACPLGRRGATGSRPAGSAASSAPEDGRIARQDGSLDAVWRTASDWASSAGVVERCFA